MGFLSNLLGFENSFTKNFTGDILSNPTRLLTGIDPASTKLWNSLLNRDDPALVNWFGSPGQQYYDQAQQEGIDTGAAGTFHGLADTIAGIYGGSGLSGSLGFGSLGSASGPGSVSGALTNAGNIGKVANSVSGDQNSGGGMGLFDNLLGSSSGGGSGLGGLVAGLGGALLGGIGSGNKNMTSQTAQQLDPRIAALLFGNSGSNGLLSRFQGLLDQPQTPGSTAIGSVASNYLGANASSDIDAIRNASLGLIGGTSGMPTINSPSISNPLWVTTPKSTAARINAPGQNGIDLTGAFQSFLQGGAGAAENPYLTKSLQAGADLANANFRTNLGDLTDTLQRRILPGLRDSAIGAGQYGGSRQGIAEGNALSDFTRQATDAAGKLGLANSANMIGAQAGQFDAGQNRALTALQGLSAQQYGVAGQNAGFQQQSGLSNMDADLRAQLANQGAGNDFLRANQQAQLATNALNSSNFNTGQQQNNAARIAGIGSLSGLLGQLYGYNQNAQNSDLLRAQGVSGLLSPFIGVNSTQTTTNPLYQNTGASVLGGASAGLGLYNQFKNLFGNGASSSGINSGMTGAFGTSY